MCCLTVSVRGKLKGEHLCDIKVGKSYLTGHKKELTMNE